MKMKKTIMSAALLLCGLGAFAQQNLFISQDIQSAIVNDDHSVTFNFLAPKAHRVQIAGDFVTEKTTIRMLPAWWAQD